MTRAAFGFTIVAAFVTAVYTGAVVASVARINAETQWSER